METYELIISDLKEMFNNGITLKNIKNHLLNNGCSELLANKLIRIVEIETK